MKRLVLRSWNQLREALKVNISKQDIKTREDLIKERLQEKLGKSREEVENLISPNLMELLVKVPFTTEK